MPIFETPAGPVLFIHVPKTGGTTVLTELRKHHRQWAVPDTLNQIFLPLAPHAHGEILTRAYRRRDFAYVFMIVRDPLKRLVSEYSYKKARRIKNGKPRLPDFKIWLRAIFKRYQFDRYVYSNHIRPQREFECLGAEVFRFELGMAPVFTRLRQVTGVDYPLSPERKNVSQRAEFRGVSDMDRQAIRAFYAVDYEHYGY